MTRHWNFYSFIDGRGRGTCKEGYALVILNRPLINLTTFTALFHDAVSVVCADGGANRLYDAFYEQKELLGELIPNVICGDLDSIRSDVGHFYSEKNVPIIHVSCQDTTDFEKAMMRIPAQIPVVALGAIGGRFDQTMSSINILYKYPERQIYLVNSSNILFLLCPGVHEIECHSQTEGPSCGLLPVGTNKATVKTSGLEWNLDETMVLEFGKLLSTSNHIISNIVSIEVITGAVVWTVEARLGVRNV